MKSFKLFIYYFLESKKEFENDKKLYLTYTAYFVLASLVQSLVEYFFKLSTLEMKVISKIIFSIIPILILSKIFYVLKIRFRGVGDYSTILQRYLTYSGLYFLLILMSALLYIFSLKATLSFLSLKWAVVGSIFTLLPLFYCMLYFSLSPLVAVFDDDLSLIEVFKTSKKLSQKKTFLVLINHLFSLAVPIFFSLTIFIENAKIKWPLILMFSISEAILSIFLTITTARIYLYLNDVD
jgi:hypothetical protein